MLLLSLVSLVAAFIVDPALGIDSVEQYAGYFNVTHGQLFFWMFTARQDPCNAPTIFWFNGGPGAGSMPAIFFENGPVKTMDDGSMQYNKYSWNDFANVVYIDQPVGTGYSVSNTTLSNTNQATLDVVDFVDTFYQQFPRLKANDLHFAGESYAGRYIPTFAKAVMNKGTKEIKSLMLGNAQVDYPDTMLSIPDMFCGKDGMNAVLDNQTCNGLGEEVKSCKQALEKCAQTMTEDDCWNAYGNACYDINNAPTVYNEQYDGNPYHLGIQCEPSKYSLCVSVTDTIASYLSQSNVLDALGVSPSITEYELVSSEINNNWDLLDYFYQSSLNVTDLMINSAVQVLVFSGDLDGIVPFKSSRTWTRGLEWWGKSAWKTATSHPSDWVVSGTKMGKVSNVGPLTLLRVFNSGHMVSYDQPAAAYAMAKKWVAGEPL